MNVLVIGAGVYVTGRGTAGIGTVLPSLAEASRILPIRSVTLSATRSSAGGEVEAAISRVNDLLGTTLRADYRPATDLLADSGALREFDCAIVCVPDDLHAVVTEPLLRLGLHAFVVKPLAPCLAQARRLEAVRLECGLYGAVDFHKRFDEANLVVKRLLDERRLGRLSHLNVEYSQRHRVPLDHFRAWAARTNVFQYLGVHYVDLVHFLTGMLPLSAMAAGTRGILDRQGVSTWDSVHAIVTWQAPGQPDERLLTQFDVGWIDSDRSKAMSNQKYRVVGENGRIECNQQDRGVELVTDEEGVEAVNPYFSQVLAAPDGRCRFAGYGYQSIFTFLSDVQAIRSRRVLAADLAPSRPTFAQALVSTAVLEAVNASLADHSSWKTVHASS